MDPSKPPRTETIDQQPPYLKGIRRGILMLRAVKKGSLRNMLETLFVTPLKTAEFQGFYWGPLILRPLTQRGCINQGSALS